MSSISVIGVGGMARAIAHRAVAAGHEVEVVGRDSAKAASLVAELGERVTVGEFGSAPAGEIVVLAVPYASAADVIARYGDALAGKVVIDISNTFNADATALVVPEGSSGAQQIAAALPPSAHVVKAFNTLFSTVLSQERSFDVFFAGDDAEAKDTVSAFIASIGLHPLDVGGLAMSQWLEGVGPLLMGLARNGVGSFNLALRVDLLG